MKRRIQFQALLWLSLVLVACGGGSSVNGTNVGKPAPVFVEQSTLMDPPIIWKDMSDEDLVGWIMERNADWVDFYGAYEPAQKQLARLTPGQRALYCCQWLDYELQNGGFHQFFGNSTGMIGPEALEGFKLFGMNEAAIAIQAAFDFAKFDPYPRERKDREQRLPDYDANKEKWRELDDAYYDAVKDKTTAEEYDYIIAAKQAAYIRAHPEQFFVID
jgi:hypothetical protein